MDDFKTQQKPVILVTGGAKRLGAAFCRGFASAGWRVVIHANHSLEEARMLVAELGGEECARVVQTDLREFSADDFLHCVVGCFGRLDAVINNASTYRRRQLLELAEKELKEDFQVNFLAPFGIMRAFARLGNPGVIVNVLGGRIAKLDAECPGYLLAKKSLAEATELCALDWGGLGIRVNGLAPGLVRPREGVDLSVMNPLLERTPLKRRTTEEQLVASARYLVETDGVTGTILYVDGGLHLAEYDIGERKP